MQYEYLLLVTGRQSEVQDFRRRAENPKAGLTLSLANLLPPPYEALEGICELDIAHYHLFVEGNPQTAAAVLAEIGETLPVRATSEHFRSDLRAYQRAHPDAVRSAHRVSTLVKQLGTTSVGGWKQTFWGDTSDLRDVALKEALGNRLVWHVKDTVRRRIPLHELAMREEALGVGLIEVAPFCRLQSHGFKEPGESHLILEDAPLDGEEAVNLLLDKPEWFYLQAA